MKQESRLRRWTAEFMEEETRSLRLAVIAGIGLLILTYVVSISVRFLINDDYQTLYTAWLKSQGKVAGKDYFLTSYYLLVDFIAPLFRIFRNTFFPLYFMRFAFLIMMLAISWLLLRITRQLCSSTAGFLAPICLLATTGMLQRGLDLRPDLITNLLWLIILLILLNSDSFPRGRFLLMGALLALAALNRFKGLMILPLVAGYSGWLLYLEPSGRVRSALKALADFLLGAAIVLIPYFVWVAATDGLGEFIRVNRLLFRDLSRLSGDQQNILWQTLSESLWHDVYFWILTLCGFVLRVRRCATFPMRTNILIASLFGTAVLTIVANPAYYAYNLLTLQTLLAPFTAYGLAEIVKKVRSTAWAEHVKTVLTVLVVLSPLLWNWPGLMAAVRDSNRHQKNLDRFIQRYVPQEGKVFGLEGLGLFRSSVYHWRFPAVLSSRYQRGEWNYAQEFRSGAPELIIVSYRVPGWLTLSDARFISEHYVPITPLLYVPGFDTLGKNPDSRFELLVGGMYEFISFGSGPNLLDGKRIEGSGRKYLEAGPHRLQVGEGRCALRRYYPPEAHSLVSNPEGLPYLAAPSLSLPTKVVVPDTRSRSRVKESPQSH